MRRRLSGTLRHGWMVLVFLLAGPARADEFDTLNFTAVRAVKSDSNLFRLPDAADANALLGKPTRSEEITSTLLGFKLSKPYSLQRFEFEFNYLDYNYKNFKYLNFAALNYNAAWRWKVTPTLSGNASLDSRQSLNSFADYRGFGVRNISTVEFGRVDSSLELDGAWRLTGALNQLTVSNEQPIVQDSDFRQVFTEIGVRRDFRSGSVISFTSKFGRGTFFKRSQPNTVSLIDTGFAEQQHEVRLLWAPRTKLSVDARIARLQRQHDTFAIRDYAGTALGATVNWGVTGKFTLKGGWQRDFNTFQDTGSSYVRIDTLSVGPAWELTPKATLRARYELVERDYLGSGPALTQRRTDEIRTLLLGVDWSPIRSITLSATLQNDKRTSTRAGFDFVSTSALLAAQLGF